MDNEQEFGSRARRVSPRTLAAVCDFKLGHYLAEELDRLYTRESLNWATLVTNPIVANPIENSGKTRRARSADRRRPRFQLDRFRSDLLKTHLKPLKRADKDSVRTNKGCCT